MENKQMPEVALVREYQKTVEAAVRLENKYESGEIPVVRFFELTKALQTRALILKEDAQNRFIMPRLKNINKNNLHHSFVDWKNAWGNCFSCMSLKTRNRFEKLENQYLEQGTCPEYERITLPEKYAWSVTDCTDEKWKNQIIMHEGASADSGNHGINPNSRRRQLSKLTGIKQAEHSHYKVINKLEI